MKKIIYSILLLLFSISLSAQNVHWGGVLNNSYNDNIYDIKTDKDNSLIICGQFSGTIDFDPGPGTANLVTSVANNWDIFLAKYDSVGNYVWAKSYGSLFQFEDGDRIAVDTAGNIFMTGMFGGSVDFDPDAVNTAIISASGNNRARFLVKYDPAGNFIAVRHIGNAVGGLPSSQDGQSGIACDADGNVYVSGFYGTSLTLAPGTTLSVQGLSDNYLAKYNAQLDLNWAFRIGSIFSEYTQGIFVYPSGQVIQLGSFNNTVDFDPGPGTFNMTQISSTQEGYFASYDSSGQFQFVKPLTAGTSATPIVAFNDSQNRLIIAGSCAGIMDADPDTGVANVGDGWNDQAFVASYDSVGNYHWAVAYGDINSYNAIRYAGIDTSDNIYVAGNYNPMMDINPGPDTAMFGNIYASYVSSFDSAGNFRTAFTVPEVRMCVKDNDIYLAGGFYGLVDFDPGPQSFPLQSDTANSSWYLLRLHQCDNYSATPGTISIPAICTGDTVTFSVNQGGPQFQWQFSSGLIPVGSVTGDSVTVVIIDTAAIQENVFVYSVGGCMNSPMVYSVLNINQPLVPVIIWNFIGDTLMTQSPALFYQWYLDGMAISTDSVFLPQSTGWYMVMTTDNNGCSAFSDSLFILLEGLNELNDATMSVYPNPFINELTVSFIGSAELRSIVISDISGKEIISLETRESELRINTSTMASGMYFLTAETPNGSFHKRIVR